MSITKISGKSPFEKDLLVRDDCFILDNGANGKIFVWKGESQRFFFKTGAVLSSTRSSGNGANAEEKQVAFQMADSFIDQMKYPRMKTQASGAEPRARGGPPGLVMEARRWRTKFVCFCRWRSCPRGRRPSSSSSSSRTGTEERRSVWFPARTPDPFPFYTFDIVYLYSPVLVDLVLDKKKHLMPLLYAKPAGFSCWD